MARASGAELAGRVDPAAYRPRLRDDVEIKIFRLKWGNDYAMVANPTDLVHYQVSVEDAEVIRRMDGTRTVKEILVERLQGSGDLELEELADLVGTLRQGDFLSDGFVDTTEMVRRAADPVSTGRAKAREFAKTLSIEWSGAHRLVDWFYRNGVRFFFRPPVAVAAGLVAVLGFIAFVSVHLSGRFELGGQNAAAQTLVLLVMDYILTFIHELGHAVVLVHFGRRVKSAGFMIYFGSPAFFVESADGLMLERRQRIVQSAAGPFAELVVSGIAAMFLWAFPDIGIAQFLYTWALLNYFVVFLNLVPLLELDGYWIFSDLIQVPDLRPRSLQFIRYDLWRKLRGREHITKQEVGLALYGILGVAFTILSLYTAFFFWEDDLRWVDLRAVERRARRQGAPRSGSRCSSPARCSAGRSRSGPLASRGRSEPDRRRSGSGSRPAGGSRRRTSSTGRRCSTTCRRMCSRTSPAV